MRSILLPDQQIALALTSLSNPTPPVPLLYEDRLQLTGNNFDLGDTVL